MKQTGIDKTAESQTIALTAKDMDEERLATYPTTAFLSKDYLEAEKELLWPKIWQMVERETDLPSPGDWMTYNVADESIIVLRKEDGSLKAYIPDPGDLDKVDVGTSASGIAADDAGTIYAADVGTHGLRKYLKVR